MATAALIRLNQSVPTARERLPARPFIYYAIMCQLHTSTPRRRHHGNDGRINYSYGWVLHDPVTLNATL